MAADTKTEIREMLGTFPGFFENLPGALPDFVPITEEEAMRIVDRIRREAAASS